MTSRNTRERRPRPPLDKARLDELALAYVGRFATSRAKLRGYLLRKLRERGWSGEQPADPGAVAERLASLGYVDDRAYAAMKGRALTSRGYGARRVGAALHAAGIADEDGAEARTAAAAAAEASALRFAQRRRIGPFAAVAAIDRAARDKAVGAMLRAGHSLDIARRLVALPPGDVPSGEEDGVPD